MRGLLGEYEQKCHKRDLSSQITKPNISEIFIIYKADTH